MFDDFGKLNIENNCECSKNNLLIRYKFKMVKMIMQTFAFFIGMDIAIE